MIRILVADDHPVVRQGLKQIVAGTTDIFVVDEAATGQEVLDKVRSNYFDVVLLDITMPGASGLDILKQLRSERPELAILILSMHSEEQYAARVLRAGASGYLAKESAPDELVAAVRKISLGGKYVSPSLAEKLASDLAVDTQEPLHQTLSDREYETMRLIASGKTTAEIAEQLSLSPKTISTYRSRILEKMGMRSNTELTLYAVQNGLLDGEVKG
jgi:DNA-binding NarL/FixJ family response regulator